MNTREFLTKVRKRCTGTILGHAEHATWYSALSRQQRNDLRECVLSAMGVYHDAVLDALSTLEGNDGVHNQAALTLLQDLHEAILGQEHPFAVAGGG